MIVNYISSTSYDEAAGIFYNECREKFPGFALEGMAYEEIPLNEIETLIKENNVNGTV